MAYDAADRRTFEDSVALLQKALDQEADTISYHLHLEDRTVEMDRAEAEKLIEALKKEIAKCPGTN